MQFKHFVATRFNLRIGDWETTKNGEALLSEQWMEDRFRLFESYCLPSVLNQSNQNFTWCIFFDTQTKEADRKKINNLVMPYSNFRVFFIEGINELKSSLIHIIKSEPTDFEFAITTRLDTDDLLHKDYIKTIQDLFIPKHDTVIDIRSGYQVSIEKGESEIRNFNNPFNQFISLVEEAGNPETIFSKWHKHWENWENVVVYDKKGLWIELVHEKNKINLFNSNLEYSLKFNEEDFGVRNKLAIKKSFTYYLIFSKRKLAPLVSTLKRNLKKGLKLFGR
jgi:hypothetical protein